MEELKNYVVIAIMLTCLCVGYIIKHLIPTEKIDKFIPAIMGTLGIILNIWMNGTFSVDIMLGGLASGLASTGMYEAFHQFLKKG